MDAPRHVRPAVQGQDLQVHLPSSIHGIRKYLASGLVEGIGKVYADRIVEKFGADTLRVISEQSGRLREVPGIGRTRVKSIKAAWDHQQAERDVMVFLQTYGVTTSLCVRLVKQYGANAKALLQKDPYRVAREVTGIGISHGGQNRPQPRPRQRQPRAAGRRVALCPR